MTFSEALDRLKAGHRIQRSGWNGPGQFLFLVDTSKVIVASPGAETVSWEFHPFIAIVPVSGRPVPWLGSQTDLLSDDWQIIALESG